MRLPRYIHMYLPTLKVPGHRSDFPSNSASYRMLSTQVPRFDYVWQLPKYICGFAHLSCPGVPRVGASTLRVLLSALTSIFSCYPRQDKSLSVFPGNGTRTVDAIDVQVSARNPGG